MSTLSAGDVQKYLQSLAGSWEYPSDTVDTFKAGTPETPVTAIAVAWLPFTWALEQAHELGCSLFITHEPTFYDHRDSREELFEMDIPAARRAWLEDKGMAVIRCHDLWDRHPTTGITDAWATFLGLENLIDTNEFSRLYEIEPTTARDFARRVATSTAPLGQPGVQLVGDGDREIKTVCIGTGAISPYLELVPRFQPDLVICTDDGLDFWRDGSFAVDGGPPIVVVHHGVTEEPGVANLATQMAGAFPQVAVHHIAQKCMFEFISAEAVRPSNGDDIHDGKSVGNA